MRSGSRGNGSIGLWALAVLQLCATLAAAEDGNTGATAESARKAAALRYVSLKSDRVNLRTGPGTEYPISWVFRRAGLPVEVVEEFESWRQVRDAEGTTGWVLQSLLSGRRTAIILPWELKDGSQPPQVAIRDDDSSSAAAVAMVEAGVIANIQTCDGTWCRVTIDSYRGYVEQNKLWGVYPAETIR